MQIRSGIGSSPPNCRIDCAISPVAATTRSTRKTPTQGGVGGSSCSTTIASAAAAREGSHAAARQGCQAGTAARRHARRLGREGSASSTGCELQRAVGFLIVMGSAPISPSEQEFGLSRIGRVQSQLICVHGESNEIEADLAILLDPSEFAAHSRTAAILSRAGGMALAVPRVIQSPMKLSGVDA